MWALSDGVVTRVDPRSRRVTDRIRVGAGADAMTAGAGAVWVHTPDGLARIDPARRTVRSIPLAGADNLYPGDVSMAVGLGAVHVTSNGVLLTVPVARSELRRQEIGAVGLGPSSITAGGGRLFTTAGPDVLARIDGAGPPAATERLGFPPGRLAADSSNVWVTTSRRVQRFAVEQGSLSRAGKPLGFDGLLISAAVHADALWLLVTRSESGPISALRILPA